MLQHKQHERRGTAKTTGLGGGEGCTGTAAGTTGGAECTGTCAEAARETREGELPSEAIGLGNMNSDE